MVGQKNMEDSQGSASSMENDGGEVPLFNNSLLNTRDFSQEDYSTLAEPEKTKPWPLLRQSMIMVIILSFAYVVVFILAVVNNSLVVAAINRNPQLKTVTNIFVANLAVADILVSMMVLPITLLSNLFEGKIKCDHYKNNGIKIWGLGVIHCL